jgi:hypothetical protein
MKENNLAGAYYDRCPIDGIGGGILLEDTDLKKRSGGAILASIDGLVDSFWGWWSFYFYSNLMKSEDN